MGIFIAFFVGLIAGIFFTSILAINSNDVDQNEVHEDETN